MPMNHFVIKEPPQPPSNESAKSRRLRGNVGYVGAWVA